MRTSPPSPAGRFGWAARGPDGRLLWDEVIANGWTFEGVDDFLDQVFRGSSTSTNYLGLIAESGFTGVATTDSYNTPTTWGEWTQYAGNRPAWDPAAAAGATMTTNTNATWTMTAAGQLRGVFLADQANKSFGPGGTLFCTAVALAGRSVSIGTVVTCYYILGL